MTTEKTTLPFWLRLLITVGVIVIVSVVAGYVWQRVLLFGIPNYLAGVVGGLAAVPTWELLRRKAQRKSA